MARTKHIWITDDGKVTLMSIQFRFPYLAARFPTLILNKVILPAKDLEPKKNINDCTDDEKELHISLDGLDAEDMHKLYLKLKEVFHPNGGGVK